MEKSVEVAPVPEEVEEAMAKSVLLKLPLVVVPEKMVTRAKGEEVPTPMKPPEVKVVVEVEPNAALSEV